MLAPWGNPDAHPGVVAGEGRASELLGRQGCSPCPSVATGRCERQTAALRTPAAPNAVPCPHLWTSAFNKVANGRRAGLVLVGDVVGASAHTGFVCPPVWHVPATGGPSSCLQRGPLHRSGLMTPWSGHMVPSHTMVRRSLPTSSGQRARSGHRRHNLDLEPRLLRRDFLSVHLGSPRARGERRRRGCR